MKLLELTGVKHLKDKTPKELIDFIKSEYSAGSTKLKILGAGANGVALTDGEVVFKFWHRDSAYEKFVKYCMSNPDNPFLPKFKSKIRTLPFNIVTTSKNGEVISGLRYVKMELLQPFKSSTQFSIANESDPTDFGDLLKALDNDISDDTFDKKYVERKILRQFHSAGAKPSAEFKLLLHTLGDIIALDESMDIHSENVAQRGNQIVILDPIANGTDFQLNMKLFKNIRI